MADPQHVPELDGLDRFTVGLYRFGLTASALSLVGSAVALWRFGLTVERSIVGVVVACAGLAAWNLHLYDKRFRWFMSGLAWMGLIVTALSTSVLPESAHRVPMLAGLGLSLAAISSMALKEWFCFRLPLVRSAPLFLAGCLVPWVAGQTTWAAVLLGIGGVMVSLLALGKLRMPLHFDVGDKSKYQV